MKTAFEILKRDVRALAKNPIALLVVGALLVLPGLYAWYCIVANWDPYANTGSMPVAIVNEDAGAKSDLAGEVNIGKQVTDKIADNENIDWRIYDSKQKALEDTEACTVYATIVLPEDLSKNVLGIFEGSESEPAIEYYPNEKYNAVATKVTDGAAQGLVRQINQSFSSTVNRKILEVAQRVANDVGEKTGEADKSAIAEVKDIQADLDKVIASLDDAMTSIDGWRTATSEIDSALVATADQLPNIRALIANGSAQLDDLRVKSGNFESGLSKTILGSTNAISSISGEATANIARATQDLKTVRSDLAALEKAAKGNAELEAAVYALGGVTSVIETLLGDVDERMSHVNAEVQQTTYKVADATSKISGNVMPRIDSGTYSLVASLSKLSDVVAQIEPQVGQLRSVLSKANGALDEASTAITDAKALLITISDDLKGTIADIGTIGQALDVEQISKLIEVEPERLGTFISTPVQMVTEKVFPVSNYGTGVAPFYTNLALWIGCFILVSLMKVEVRGFPKATPRQRYFGRWLLFVILSLLQSQVICGVDILLGIDCANPALFMLAGAVCSFAYMNLIYALVKTFRNIGKTLCIFLLIMQVPGSSGMYPIDMMPGFFQFIHPALPFTYGIDAMREALSGLYGLSYAGDLVALLLIVPGSLIIGLGVRRIMANVLLMFDEEMNKVGFFASEEYEAGLEKEGVRSMLRALKAHDAYADDIEERAWRFNRMYPRLRRLGSMAVFVVPLVTLVLMLPINVLFNLSPDVKLAVLIVMLVVFFIAQLALIVLEYTHRSIEEETRLIGADLLDGFDLEGLMGEGAAGGADTSPSPGFAAVVAPTAAARRAQLPKGNPA
ncbi:MAG: YhgE/Pip domain-containing protein, partial [Eggerthellaceae bacterium]|nr:YhgE/Pip domain-containing protein [Eggerthellaceae bacterium]